MEFLERRKPLGLLALRGGLAVIFFHHGYLKLTNTGTSTQFFVQVGFPSYFAYISAVIEVFGSILLLGLFTRGIGLILAGEMAIAIWRVHLPQGGIRVELQLALAVASFALATTGAGIISLDHAIYGLRPARRAKSKN
jgi:putative oxidoreductase